MNISSPPSSHQRSAGVARVARHPSGSGWAVAFLLLTGSLSCSDGSSADEAEAPRETEAPGEAGATAVCTSNADCADAQVCQSAACVSMKPIESRIVDAQACTIVSCPESESACCSAAAASATGNQNQSYSSQLQMLWNVGFNSGEVRADFRFDAPNQQGWLTFQLGAELDLDRLAFTGWHDGVSDHFLSVDTKQRDGGGCAFAFEPERRPAPDGSSIPFVLHGNVDLDDDSFCYGGGQPGRASELAFAIFSTEPGPATLVISNIKLTAE
jgi:hypothetical protein